MTPMSWTVLFISFVLADRPPEPASLPPPPEPLRPGFEAIEEADLRAWVGFLASDELEGRESGSHGYDVASRFSAGVLARQGVKPGGVDGSFFQEFDIIRGEADEAASSIEVKDAAGAERFALSGDLALGAPREVSWTGGAAFAGNGHGPEGDSRGDYDGLPVRERIVLVLPTSEWTSFSKRDAEAAGAARVLVVSDDAVRRKLWLGPFARPGFQPPSEKPPAPADLVYVSRKVANRILRPRGLTVEGLLSAGGKPPCFDLPGTEVKVEVRYRDTRQRTRNVVGILEGSDPARKAEVVVLGAHLDHIGEHDGKVFHGADDDASGASGILALARAFSETPRRPARSILFLLFAAEEKGLWGSWYFVEHPTVPLPSLFAEIQLDMIGRNEEVPKVEGPEANTNSVHLVGSAGTNKGLLGPLLKANRFVGLDFEYDMDMVFGSSDQFNFARKGIPVGFLFTGLHPDYHQPTDTAEKINYAKMVRILRLAFAAAYDIADRAEPLRSARRM